jgi:hypothetical protein
MDKIMKILKTVVSRIDAVVFGIIFAVWNLKENFSRGVNPPFKHFSDMESQNFKLNRNRKRWDWPAEKNMKDILGREIQVGDYILYAKFGDYGMSLVRVLREVSPVTLEVMQFNEVYASWGRVIKRRIRVFEEGLPSVIRPKERLIIRVSEPEADAYVAGCVERREKESARMDREWVNMLKLRKTAEKSFSLRFREFEEGLLEEIRKFLGDSLLDLECDEVFFEQVDEQESVVIREVSKDFVVLKGSDREEILELERLDVYQKLALLEALEKIFQ